MKRLWCWAGASLAMAFTQFGALHAAKAAEAKEVREFKFAEREFGDWTLWAETQLSWQGKEGRRFPYVDNVSCHAISQDFEIAIDQTGSFGTFFIRFQGMPDKGGYRDDITVTGDHLWLYLDGQRWELAQIQFPEPKFENATYPKMAEDAIIIPVWNGSTYLRRNDNDPWMRLDNHLGTVIAAKKIEWGFKSRNWAQVDRSEPDNQLPEDWKTRRYPIRNDGIREAVDWCLKAVRSKEARTLPKD